jgi:hypothetical protein
MSKQRVPFPHESVDIIYGILREAEGRYLKEEMMAFRTSSRLINRQNASPHLAEPLQASVDYAEATSRCAATARDCIGEFIRWLENRVEAEECPE